MYTLAYISIHYTVEQWGMGDEGLEMVDGPSVGRAKGNGGGAQNDNPRLPILSNRFKST